MKDEFIKLRDALSTAGFTPADAVFEGAISVKDTQTLKLLEELKENGNAVGTLKILYFAKPGMNQEDLRVIEIPVGHQEQDEDEEIEEEHEDSEEETEQ